MSNRDEVLVEFALNEEGWDYVLGQLKRLLGKQLNRAARCSRDDSEREKGKLIGLESAVLAVMEMRKIMRKGHDGDN